MMKAKVKSAIAATNGTEPVSCPPVWDIVDYHYTCIDVHEGDADEPSGYCDDPNNWLQGEPIWDWVYPPGDCYEGGEDDYCEGMTNETCMCETYGLGCDDGGGEEGIVLPSIEVDLDPCNESVYNKINAAAGGLNSSVVNFVNSYFTNYEAINLRIQDGYNFTDPDVYGEWKPSTQYPLTYFINLSSKLTNTSQEFRAYVMLHEIYHGYLYI